MFDWLKRLLKQRSVYQAGIPSGKNLAQEPTQKMTQQSLIRRSAPEVSRIQVGVDFGTSATKVAYWKLGDNYRHALLFKHSLACYPQYCLPSLAALDDEDRVLLGIEAARYLEKRAWDEGIRGMKVLVSGNYNCDFQDQELVMQFENAIKAHSKISCEFSPETLTAGFLAYTFRTIRDLIEKKEEFKNKNIDLAFNVGIPIDHIEENPIRDAFEKILAWAEIIERKWPRSRTTIEWDEVRDLEHEALYERTDGYLRKDPTARVFLVPEAVAESIAYLKSLRRRKGIHALVDLGAGTTDVSIFHVTDVKTSDPVYWYAARNVPCGGLNIERLISNHLTKKGIPSELEVAKTLKQIVINGSSGGLSQEIMSAVEIEIRKIWRSTLPVWSKAYAHHKKQSFWERNKVQVILSGGGSDLPYAEDIFSKSWMDGWGPYGIHTLPVPGDFKASAYVPFYRMSVAYGLTIPVPELGDTTLPSDSPDTTPPPPPMWEAPGDGYYPTDGWFG